MRVVAGRTLDRHLGVLSRSGVLTANPARAAASIHLSTPSLRPWGVRSGGQRWVEEESSIPMVTSLLVHLLIVERIVVKMSRRSTTGWGRIMELIMEIIHILIHLDEVTPRRAEKKTFSVTAPPFTTRGPYFAVLLGAKSIIMSTGHAETLK